MTERTPDPEFSRPLVIDRLGGSPITMDIRANAAECGRLSERLGLVALNSLAASVTFERRQTLDVIHVTGTLEADIVQTCVVSLAPFASHIEDGFAIDFTTLSGPPADEVWVDIENDPPEPIENGVIDAGELAAQFLSLALDPYPRAPGAQLEAGGAENDQISVSPFAVLRNLKQ
jgi:hypothetical protein